MTVCFFFASPSPTLYFLQSKPSAGKEWMHCLFIWSHPTYNILLPQIFTSEPNVDESAAENKS